jgi:hypothetical protein
LNNPVSSVIRGSSCMAILGLRVIHFLRFWNMRISYFWQIFHFLLKKWKILSYFFHFQTLRPTDSWRLQTTRSVSW